MVSSRVFGGVAGYWLWPVTGGTRYMAVEHIKASAPFRRTFDSHTPRSCDIYKCCRDMITCPRGAGIEFLPTLPRDFHPAFLCRLNQHRLYCVGKK
jgi:hypothetical protein